MSWLSSEIISCINVLCCPFFLLLASFDSKSSLLLYSPTIYLSLNLVNAFLSQVAMGKYLVIWGSLVYESPFSCLVINLELLQHLKYLVPTLFSNLRPTKKASQHALLQASEARLTGALSKGGKMRGVATNVYLWKTSEKPKETGQNENPKFGSCIYVWGRY